MPLKQLLQITALLCLFIGQSSFALTPAQKWIERMGASARSLDYQGHFIYSRGSHSSSYKIVHILEDSLEKQRLVFLDGNPLEVISDGHSLTCIHPGDTNFRGEHAAEFQAVAKINRSLPAVWEYYQASIAGESRVADRKVTVVKMIPKDHHRYPYVFFIDSESGLMLKMLILDTKGKTLERFQYVSIDYENVSKDDLKPQIQNYTVVDHSMMKHEDEMEKSAAAKKEENWRLSWMPSGFKREKTKMQIWEQKAHDDGEVLMYSDGVSAFSVFVENASKPLQQGISRRVGSTSAVSHYLRMGDNYYSVTVVGEVPLMTAKQIASALRRSDS